MQYQLSTCHHDADAFTTAVRDQRYAPWARKVDDLASRAGNVGTPDLRLDGKTVPLSVLMDREALARTLGL